MRRVRPVNESEINNQVSDTTDEALRERSTHSEKVYSVAEPGYPSSRKHSVLHRGDGAKNATDWDIASF